MTDEGNSIELIEDDEVEVLSAEEEALIKQAMVGQSESAVILPVFYRQAVIAIEDADRLDECRDYIGKAEMIGVYAKQAKDDRMMNMAHRISARAWRRLGELLHALPRSIGVGRGRELKMDKWATAIVPCLGHEYQRAADLARKAGLTESQARRTLTELAAAGIAESRTTAGFRLPQNVDAEKLTPDDLKKAVTARAEQRNVARRVHQDVPQSREATLRGMAETQHLTASEQTKAMRIAEIPGDVFHEFVENARAPSGRQLLMLRRALAGSASPAYGLGKANMRRVIEREVAEFKRFVDLQPIQPIVTAYASEVASMRARLTRLIKWCRQFEEALEARK